MGKRSTSRRLAMQALYQAEAANINIKEAIRNLFAQEKLIQETRDFSADLAEGAWGDRPEIDKIIKKYSREWKLERMGRVDRNILRLAIYEIIKGETPPQVVIDEAVELTKKYSSPEAAKFINGILGKYLEDFKGLS